MLERFPRFRAFRNFTTIAAVLAASVIYAVRSVVQPLESGDPTGSSPLGYTKSLVLFLAPLAALTWWFAQHRETTYQKRAFWRSIAILVPLGFALDLLFANTFFRFPNHGAVLGECTSPAGEPLAWSAASLLCIPARGGVVPVEEFVFYLSGFMVVLLAYIWADEYWLERYNLRDYENPALTEERLVRLQPSALILGVALTLLAFVAKWWFGGEGAGAFPGYAIFLIFFSIVPTAWLFPAARPCINWRAFSFTFFLILLVSLVWEATLALPYGWWGYREDQMMGIAVEAWFDLPLEAVVVWFAVTFTTVVIFEVVKLWQASGKSAKRAFLGRR